MYVKIQKPRTWFVDYEGNRGIWSDQLNKVVPMDVHILEGKRIRYNKFRVLTLEEFHKFEEALAGSCWIPFGEPDIHDCGENGRCSDCGKGAEFLLIEIEDGDGENCQKIIASDCAMFVMNEAGKTIDRISCY